MHLRKIICSLTFVGFSILNGSVKCVLKASISPFTFTELPSPYTAIISTNFFLFLVVEESEVLPVILGQKSIVRTHFVKVILVDYLSVGVNYSSFIKLMA